jgi:hypothetical protein
MERTTLLDRQCPHSYHDGGAQRRGLWRLHQAIEAAEADMLMGSDDSGKLDGRCPEHPSRRSEIGEVGVRM